MLILLFGKNGQVGWELQRSLTPLGRVIAVDFDSTDYCGDFSNTSGISETIRRVKPDLVVNAAAYTAVDRAESEPKLANLLNSITVEVIAKEVEALGSWLIHYSTDYVFDGSGESSWLETDTPSPLNVYGETKLAGELAIQACCQKYLIFRTSWVYAARGTNFIKAMLQTGKERSEMSIINDQIGAPTGAELLADCTAHAISVARAHPEVSGLYHLTASGNTSWYEYAQLIFAQVHRLDKRLAVNQVYPIPTNAFPTAAKRPHNSRLNLNKFQTTFNLILPHWELGVERVLVEILA